MEYLTVSIIALIITTYVIYLTANKLFRIKLRVKPLILCALCSLFISIIIPRLLAGVLGTLGTLSTLAVCAVTFSYFLAYHDHFEAKSVPPVENPIEREEITPDLEPHLASEPGPEILPDDLAPAPQELLVEPVVHKSPTTEPLSNEFEPTRKREPEPCIPEELLLETEPVAVEQPTVIAEVVEHLVAAEETLPESEPETTEQPQPVLEAEPSLPEEEPVWEFELPQTATNLVIDETALSFEPLLDTEVEEVPESAPEPVPGAPLLEETLPESEPETTEQPQPVLEAEPSLPEEEPVWEFELPQTAPNLVIDETALSFEPLLDTEAVEAPETAPESESAPEAEPSLPEEEAVWNFELPQMATNLVIDEAALSFEPLLDTEVEAAPEVALGSEPSEILPDDVRTEVQEPEVLPESLDDLLDYAFDKKETGQSQSALAAFTKAFELYKETNDAPFIIVELSNLLKNCGQYDQVIDVFTEGCTLQVIRQNQGMYEQFSEMIAFMKIIKQNLVDHQLGMIPYNQIPADLMHKINEDFHEWRILR